jgi:chromosome segregation ATPase
VLSEEFLHLKKNIRQSLLFYGSGHRVVVASVEIIFDNTDKQLPVSLRDQVLILGYTQGTLIY